MSTNVGLIVSRGTYFAADSSMAKMDSLTSAAQKAVLLKALQQHGWNVSATARAIGWSLRGLQYACVRHHIDAHALKFAKIADKAMMEAEQLQAISPDYANIAKPTTQRSALGGLARVLKGK